MQNQTDQLTASNSIDWSIEGLIRDEVKWMRKRKTREASQEIAKRAARYGPRTIENP